MNKILAFDTSNNTCSVAVSIGQNIITFEQELRPSMQAEKLIVLIEKSLKEANMNYNDLDYLTITIGPGSFTGIRIGVAAAKGIIYTTKIKSVGITNFEAAYYRIKQQISNFDYAIILLNAYRNQQYIQIFNKHSAITKETLVDNESVVEIIKNYKGVKACAGSGVSCIYDKISDIQNLFILPRFPIIKATHIARLADEKINIGKIEAIEYPLYIRQPDATPN